TLAASLISSARNFMTGTSATALVDTNVLIYSFDPSDPARRVVAQQLIQRLIAHDQLVFSVQIFNEFLVNATRARRGDPPLLRYPLAVEAVRIWSRVCPVIPVDLRATLEAASAVRNHTLHFWDALIWAAARLHDVS